MSYLIRTQGLTKRYDDFTLATINLAVEAGSVVGFVGTNGAGKTTTLKAILGLIAADEGTVELLGERVTVGSKTIDALKSRIGIVFDTCAFPSTCRVSDVGSMGRGAYQTWNQARFEELCHTFDLAPKKKIQELSRGMGMKLTLSFALSHDPELLILDEATAGLDPMARDEVIDILRQFMDQPGHGILMSTHITSDLEKLLTKSFALMRVALCLIFRAKRFPTKLVLRIFVPAKWIRYWEVNLRAREICALCMKRIVRISWFRIVLLSRRRSRTSRSLRQLSKTI